RIAPLMRLVSRMKQRLERRGDNQTHSLYRAVSEAYHPLHGLRITPPYESCRRGGRRTSPNPTPHPPPSQNPPSPPPPPPRAPPRPPRLRWTRFLSDTRRTLGQGGWW